jgi:hypothetical protein
MTGAPEETTDRPGAIAPNATPLIPDESTEPPSAPADSSQRPVPRFTKRWSARRIAITAAVTAAVIYGAVVAGLALTSSTPSPSGNNLPRAVTSLAGRVISLNPSDTIAVSDPDGLHPTFMPRLGTFTTGPLIVSPDRRYLLSQNGRLIAITNYGLAATSQSASVPAGQVAMGFAAADRAVVAIGGGTSPRVTSITLIRTVGGARSQISSPMQLGTGDSSGVAGDPQSFAVFVSVPDSSTPDGSQGLADSRIEWRAAGQAPLTVVTAAQLAKAASLDPAVPMHLAIYPDPSGDKLAVVVEPTTSGNSYSAIVILDRHGRYLGAVGVGPGMPLTYVSPTWSPDGKSIAFPAVGQYGPQLAVWSIGQPFPKLRDPPDPGLQFGSCIWSPDGTELLCPAGRTSGAEWVFGGNTGPLVSIPNPNQPITWLKHSS